MVNYILNFGKIDFNLIDLETNYGLDKIGSKGSTKI